jgi:hypothetical protein
MNALAAAPGWRDLAVWVMPAAVYALASDTLIGVVRARAAARASQAGQQLTDEEDATPMAIIMNSPETATLITEQSVTAHGTRPLLIRHLAQIPATPTRLIAAPVKIAENRG